jgi:hypothetical protein
MKTIIYKKIKIGDCFMQTYFGDGGFTGIQIATKENLDYINKNRGWFITAKCL